MHVISLETLYQTNYDVKYLDALKQFWQEEKSFSCIRQPKKQSILLYLNGCKARYITKEGKELIAEENDVVYAPQGCEYTVFFYDFQSSSSNTVGINFYLFSDEKESVLFSEEIKIFKHVNENVQTLFDRIERMSKDENVRPTQYKIALLQLLNSLAVEYSKKKQDPLLKKGVEYLRAHYAENPSVSHLASLCNVSEVYFRRLFKANYGVSPLEYRNRLRLEKAKRYLEFNEVSVREISELLGYATVSHFIKQFKAAFGVSPLQYKNALHIPIVPSTHDAN